MTFLNLISGIIGLAKSLAGLFRDRRLVKSGEARQALFQSQETLKIIKRAAAARRSISDRVHDDRFNRDN